MSHIPESCDLQSYCFELPEELIAQQPGQSREASRLMVLERATGHRRIAPFTDIGAFLPPGALLVANNSRVLPARMFGHKLTGGRVEFLLLTPLPLLAAKEPDADGFRNAQAEGLLRSAKKSKPGERIEFSDDFHLIVEARGDFGKSQVTLHWRDDLAAHFMRQGHLPLPPYIRRPDTDSDRERYQTVYSREDKLGSAAAPTAGLHFSTELKASLAAAGFSWAELTLYVGYGTFSPVRVRDIREHTMHREYIEIPEATAAAIREAKSQGRPVVAVGTTSARALEGAFAQTGCVAAFTGWTDIFMRPGYEFKVVERLLTNFHLPGSSLIMLVSALAGREAVQDAYRHAVQERMRFFSYGDAMLVL
ncbi:MAG: tRNA preQ1(34) S-adenosylmethionine ribosyltransferase-isomerase QueA [Desulfocurvibacter africanus]